MFAWIAWTVPVFSQGTPAPPQSHYHAIVDYWRKAAKTFEDGAQAATSETKKSVWTELAAYFTHGAAHFEEMADADDKALAAAREKAASQPQGPGLPPRPPSPMPVPQISPVKPQLLPIPVPAASNPGSSPLSAALSEASRCRAAADAFADDADFDEMKRRKTRFEDCHVPELMALAAAYRERAQQSLADAAAAPAASSGAPACGWNCLGHWNENEAERRKDMLKARSDQLSEIADHLTSRANAVTSGSAQTSPAAATPGASGMTVDRADGALCRALAKPPAKSDETDPYLLCDCLDEYLFGRVSRFYTDLRKRTGQDLWSATLLDAEFTAAGGRFEWSFPDALLFDIVAAEPLAADHYACHLDLLQYEVSRVRAAWPREVEVGAGLLPTAPTEAVQHLKSLRQTVYRTVRDRLTALWHMDLEEVRLAVTKVAYDQDEFDWSLRYKAKGELKKLYDETIGPQIKAQVSKIDYRDYVTGQDAVCKRDNEASYMRISEAASEMVAAVERFRGARTTLIADLLQWEALAQRDGWPSAQGDFSFKTVADQLWQTSWAGTHDKHYPEPKVIGVAVPAPTSGSVEYRSPSESANGTDDVSTFFRSHDGCTLWKPTAPLGAYLMSYEKPVSASDLSVDPEIAKDLTSFAYGVVSSFAGGPFSQTSLRRQNSSIALLAHLFEQGNKLLEAYYSGADLSQSP